MVDDTTVVTYCSSGPAGTGADCYPTLDDPDMCVNAAARKQQTRMPEIASITDLAIETGKAKQEISRMLRTQTGAPKPVQRLKRGPVYIKDDALAFVQHRQRPWPAPEWLPEWKLVARAEIAAMLGVTNGSAGAKMDHPAAPAPAADLAMGRVWFENDVKKYLAREMPGGQAVVYDIDMDVAKALHDQGMDIAKIAVALKVPRHILRQRFIDAEIIVPERRKGQSARKPVTDQERRDILAALNEPGATFNSVATRFGRHIQTVQRLQANAETE